MSHTYKENQTMNKKIKSTQLSLNEINLKKEKFPFQQDVGETILLWYGE